MKILFNINFNIVTIPNILYVYKLIIKKLTYNVNILHNVRVYYITL
jgi:hypothetical protein